MMHASILNIPHRPAAAPQRRSKGAALAVAALALTVVLLASGTARAQAQSPDEPGVGYDVIRPILRKHCGTCHSQDRARGGLDLSSLDGIKAGSSSGPVAITGKADESMIYTLAAHLETPKMPPNAPKIPQRELDLIRRWIDGGLAERGPGTVKAAAGDTAPAAKPAQPATAEKPAAARDAGAANQGAGGKLPGSVPIEPLSRPTAITALAVSPKAPLVAVSGHRQVALFQWTDRTPVAALPFPEGDVFTLRFSRDGEVLLAGGGVGGQAGKVVGFEVASGKRLFELGDEIDAVLTADISHDRSLVALGGPGRSVKVFRTADGELTATLRKHTDWILSLAFSPDGLLLASGDRFGGLQVWEAATGKEFHTLRGHVGAVNALGWSPDSERLWSAGQDGSLRQWDMHQGEALSKWDGGVGGVLCAALDSTGRIVCGGRGRKLAIWENPETSALEVPLGDEVVELAVSHDGTHAIAGDAAGNITVISLAKGELAGRLALPLAPASASPKPVIVAVKPAARPRESASPAPSAIRPGQFKEQAVSAESTSRQAAAELAEARAAQAAADAAVLAAEDSLKKQRDAAAKLKSVVSRRETAAREASERAAALRALAESSGSQKSGLAADLRTEKERLKRQLDEKRSLLEATRAVAARIEKLSGDAPGDTELKSAAKLAAQLQSSLTRDVEATVGALHLVEHGLLNSEADPSTTAER